MITHKGTVTLATPRLILRRLTPDDVPAMYENWATDALVTKYVSWSPHESPEVTKSFILKCVSDYENPECYHWVIAYGGTIIGTIGLHSIANRPERCELGYCIGSKWWNRGIVTEAAGEVIRFAFEELNMNKVSAMHDTENIGSGRVMQKNGMRREGLLREHSLRKDGTRGDLAYYAILKSEWNAAR